MGVAAMPMVPTQSSYVPTVTQPTQSSYVPQVAVPYGAPPTTYALTRQPSYAPPATTVGGTTVMGSYAPPTTTVAPTQSSYVGAATTTSYYMAAPTTYAVPATTIAY